MSPGMQGGQDLRGDWFLPGKFKTEGGIFQSSLWRGKAFGWSRWIRQVRSQEPKPILSEEEIHFDVLAMEVIEHIGEKYVVWLN